MTEGGAEQERGERQAAVCTGRKKQQQARKQARKKGGQGGKQVGSCAGWAAAQRRCSPQGVPDTTRGHWPPFVSCRLGQACGANGNKTAEQLGPVQPSWDLLSEHGVRWRAWDALANRTYQHLA